MQLVVLMAVRKAVSAATITFTANSITFCFFMIRCVFRWYGERGTASVEAGGTPEIYPLPPFPSPWGAMT